MFSLLWHYRRPVFKYCSLWAANNIQNSLQHERIYVLWLSNSWATFLCASRQREQPREPKRTFQHLLSSALGGGSRWSALHKSMDTNFSRERQIPRQPRQYLSDGKSLRIFSFSLITATGNLSNRDVNFCKKHEMSLDKKGLNLLNVDQKCIRHTL